MKVANLLPNQRSLRFLLTLLVSHFCVGTAISQEGNESETSSEAPPQSIIVVQGAGGKKEYEKTFTEACEKIRLAAQASKSEFEWIGNPQQESSQYKNAKEHLLTVLSNQSSGNSQLWIILMGHGTFDRQAAKFNLRGPDVSAKEIDESLSKIERPVVVVNCASSSAPFINRLTQKGRVVITATKSGFELNYTRFGPYFAEALSDLTADIDKDDQVSVLEAFLFASRKVDEFYKTESRLATEHALIDDNGDGKGTPLTFFRGVRVIKKTSDDASPDGPTANRIHLIKSEFEKLLTIEMRAQRKELESRLEELRLNKSKMDEEEYFLELEKISHQLALIYQTIEKKAVSGQKEKSVNPDKKSEAPKAAAAGEPKK